MNRGRRRGAGGGRGPGWTVRPFPRRPDSARMSFPRRARSSRPARPAVAAEIAGGEALEARALLTTLTLAGNADAGHDVTLDANVTRVELVARAGDGNLHFGDVTLCADAVAGELEVVAVAGADLGHVTLDAGVVRSGPGNTHAVRVDDLAADRFTITTGSGDDVLGDLATRAGGVNADRAGRIELDLGAGADRVGNLSAVGGDWDFAGSVAVSANGSVAAGRLSARGGDGAGAGQIDVHFGRGPGRVALRGARLADLIFVGSGAADGLTLTGGRVDGHVRFLGGAGEDRVAVRRTRVGSLIVKAGGGDDAVRLAAVSAADGPLRVDGGGGGDRVALDRARAARLAVDAGDDRDDRLTADRATADRLPARLARSLRANGRSAG